MKFFKAILVVVLLLFSALLLIGVFVPEVDDEFEIKMAPLQSVKFKLYNEMFEFDISVKFEMDGMSTVLNTYVQMKGNGLIERSLLPLMKSSIMEVGKDNFEALKQLQEQ